MVNVKKTVLCFVVTTIIPMCIAYLTGWFSVSHTGLISLMPEIMVFIGDNFKGLF